MNKELPKTIQIGKKTWTIKWEKPPQGRGKKRTYGLCKFTTRELIIDPDVDDLELIDSTLHEVLHALFPNASEGKVLRGTDVIINMIADIFPIILDRNKRDGIK